MHASVHPQYTTWYSNDIKKTAYRLWTTNMDPENDGQLWGFLVTLSVFGRVALANAQHFCAHVAVVNIQ